MSDIGRLRVQCFNGESYIPVDNCNISIEPSKTET